MTSAGPAPERPRGAVAPQPEVRVHVGALADVPADRCVAVADGRAIVVRVGDGVVAFPNRCLHRDSPLAGGRVFAGRLTCPLHFWRYRLPDGAHVGGEGRLAAHAVEVVDGEVIVRVPAPEPTRPLRDVLLGHARHWDRDGGASP